MRAIAVNGTAYHDLQGTRLPLKFDLVEHGTYFFDLDRSKLLVVDGDNVLVQAHNVAQSSGCHLIEELTLCLCVLELFFSL